MCRSRKNMLENFIALEFFCFRGDEEHAGELIISQEPRHGTEKRYSSFSKDGGGSLLRSTRNFSESSVRSLLFDLCRRLKGKTDCKQLFESRGREAKVIREFIVAIAFHRFSIFFQPSARFPLQKECEKAGHLASYKPCARRRKQNGYANGGGGLEASTPSAYTHPCSARWINTFFFPPSKTTTRVNVFLAVPRESKVNFLIYLADLTRRTGEKFYREKLTEKSGDVLD